MTDSGHITDLDSPQELVEEKEVPCQMIVGRAGTGKTYSIMQRVAEDESYGLLCSTTGVSAVNLGATTINSALGYFDTQSLKDAYLNGSVIRRLHSLAKDYRRLIIDEMSMMEAEQLTYIYRGVRDANAYSDVKEPMGILLTGDLAQLPNVSGEWIFESPYWPRFEKGKEVLTKNWRQGDQQFIDALNAIRQGNGRLGADLLSACGCQWHTMRHVGFEGTTILPDNASVNRHNEAALDMVQGEKITVQSRRWGKQRSEWGENRRTREWGIPPRMELKIGAYVMLLSNQSDGEGGFEYVNGDCGFVREYVPYSKSKGVGSGLQKWLTSGETPEHFIVELVRGGTVSVETVVRNVETDAKPEGFTGPTISKNDESGGLVYMDRPHYRSKVGKYVLGQIEYWPIRVAYASTIHKSQSLTLDKVQFDFRQPFARRPAMAYVALSRVKSAQGLRLVGDKDYFVKSVNVDERVRAWL